MKHFHVYCVNTMRTKNIGSMDETELLYRSLRGEKQAWGEIAKRYKRAVYGVNLALLKDRTEAEDATQETFIKAWNNLEKYDMNRKFSTWLFTIGSNISKNIIRKRDRWRFINNLPLVKGKNDPQTQVRKEKRVNGIREAVFSLSAKYRAPLILRFWGEQSYQEISQILDIPEGTVKTRLHRGKTRVKELCKQKGVK